MAVKTVDRSTVLRVAAVWPARGDPGRPIDGYAHMRPIVAMSFDR
jgi:hypothetical protein